MPIETKTPTVLEVRWSHVIFTAALWLVSVGTIYGSMRAQLDEMQRRATALEEKKADQRQVDELREDIIHRLDRIEEKVDRERNIRSVH